MHSHRKPPVAEIPALAEAVVDLEAIRHNIRQFTAALPDKQILAVVKSNGFGHGVCEISRAAIEAGATWLGVATPREALELRAAGFTEPILSWLPLFPFLGESDYERLIDERIDVSVIHPDELHQLARVAKNENVARVHLKIDTGNHRSGCDTESWPALCELAARYEAEGRIQVIGVWSHLYHGLAEDGGTGNQLQTDRLLEALDTAKRAGLNPEQIHLANSAGAIRLPEVGLTMVRIGASLYGIYRQDLDLRYAMTLQTKIAAVHSIDAGEGVGYDHTWHAQRSSHLGLIPLGFADGIPRDISEAEVLVVDRQGISTRVPIVGRVSMDQCVIDLTGTGAQLSDTVLVFGDGTRGEPTADDWAIWANTNQHDIFCGVGERVERIYLNPSLNL